MNKIKVGIIGAGMIVYDMFNFIHEIETIEIKAISATKNSEEKLKQLKEKHHLANTYTNYLDMLENDEIDTVYVASPNHLHYGMVKASLLKGKHVICEKPFTSNKKELDELVEIATKKGLFLVEAISNQYLKNYLSIKENLPQLGNIKIVQCNYSQYSSRYNAFKEGNIMPAFDYKKSGGALMDLNIYNIHFVVGLFGQPLRVDYLANIEKNIDTSGVLLMDYGHFKCVCIGAKDCASPVTTNIQGDMGCIHLDTPMNVCQSYQLIHNDRSFETIDLSQGHHRMYDEFVSFASMIINKDMETCLNNLKHSQIVMEVVDLAKASANIVFEADKGEQHG